MSLSITPEQKRRNRKDKNLKVLMSMAKILAVEPMN